MGTAALPWETTVFLIITIGILGWLGWMSWLLFRTVRHYRALVARPGEDLETVLKRMQYKLTANQEEIAMIQQLLKTIRDDMRIHIQHIGFVRFNPFGKHGTGGDQSFALALLDDEKNGIMISSLHSRGGTRFYAKPVIAGKGREHPLTEEEKQAVEESIRPSLGGGSA